MLSHKYYVYFSSSKFDINNRKTFDLTFSKIYSLLVVDTTMNQPHATPTIMNQPHAFLGWIDFLVKYLCAHLCLKDISYVWKLI